MTTPAAAPTKSGRLLTFFLGSTLLSSLGSVMALLASTVLASDTGSSGGLAATYTSIMLALNLIAASVTTPYGPALAARWGTRRVYGTAVGANVLLYGLLTAGLLIGLPGYPLLLLGTPLLGAVGGISRALYPAVLQGYLAHEDLASAETKASVAAGAAWVIGAIVGAVVIDSYGVIAGFAANTLLSIPYLLVVLLITPEREPARPTPAKHPWRSLVTSMRTNKRLRRASVLGLLAAALVAPLASMVVPVTQDLDHNLAIHAGFILAAISFGAILSPSPVYRLGSRMGPLRASGYSYAVTGVVLVILGVVAVLFTQNLQLAAIAAFAVIYGALSQSGGNLLVQDAADSAETIEHEQQNLAVFFLITGIGTPIGTLLWGRTIDATSVPFLFAVAGGIMVLFVIVNVILLTRQGVSAPPAVAKHEKRQHAHGIPLIQRMWH